MIYSNEDMRNMLEDFAGIDGDALDIMIKIMGDTPQTYIKILNTGTEYKTFKELEDSMFFHEYV